MEAHSLVVEAQRASTAGYQRLGVARLTFECCMTLELHLIFTHLPNIKSGCLLWGQAALPRTRALR